MLNWIQHWKNYAIKRIHSNASQSICFIGQHSSMDVKMHGQSKLSKSITIIGTIFLLITTAVITFIITTQIYPGSNCGQVELGKLNFPKDDPEWSEVDRLEITDKGIVISRPTGGNRCYLLPLRSNEEDPNTPRPLIVLNQPLTTDMLEHLAGSNGAAFCTGYESYLARELKNDEILRGKRESENATSQGSSVSGSVQGDIFASSKDQGKNAMEIPMDEREPRCNEVILDCSDHVGQVQSCYTWVNGVMWMDRKCTDSKQFQVHMTKPPGRILKIAQQQWIICLQRRSQGLTC